MKEKVLAQTELYQPWATAKYMSTMHFAIVSLIVSFCSQWIYQNVYSKWDNIVKRPEKLVAMFTGYHANQATIHAAFRNAGVNEKLVDT